jgi:hypothetical protein
MFGIAASARAASRRSALEQDPNTIGTSNVVSSMEGLSGNLPSAGSAQEGIIAAGARVAQKQVGMRTPQPIIPMSESYNSASSRPVFNDRAQSRAKSIFGDNNQRQVSVNGSCEK